MLRAMLPVMLPVMAVALFLGPAAGPAPAQGRQTLTGTLRTSERPQPQALEVVRVDGVDYLDLQVVAREFHGTKYWRAELEKMVLKVGGRRVRLTVGSPYVFVDDRGQNLLAPVIWHDGRIFVPVRLTTDILDGLVGESVGWDPATRALTLGSGDPNLLAVTWDVRANGTVLEVELTEPRDGRLEFPRPDRVVLHVPDGVLGEGLLNGVAGRGLVDSVEASQGAAEAVLTLRLGPLGGTAEVLTRRSPPRLLVAVSEGLPDDIPLPEFERGEDAVAQRTVRKVVIDPGHGGSDAGTVAGTAEKDVALAIAKRLRDRLQGDGLEVVLTRDDDRFLSNEERARIANAAGGDVLISLHGNGWFQDDRRGFSLGTWGGPAATAPSEFSRWGEPDPLVLRQTESLAAALLEELQTLDIPSRGVRSAPYAVLAGATMPAVLLECGYLTNRDDRRRLEDDDYQAKLASAIARGIDRFRGGGGG
jgi:N-acetylmuramoyl-L-alanine amidase